MNNDSEYKIETISETKGVIEKNSVGKYIVPNNFFKEMILNYVKRYIEK